MDFVEITKYGNDRGYEITTRNVPGINEEQVVCIRPDGYEQVFYKRDNYINLIRYEIDNYIPFNHPIDKKQRFGLKDFGLKNIKNFISGTLNEFRDKTIGLPEYEKKQYEMRYSICSKCKHNNSKSCDQNTISLDTKGSLQSGCGCDFPGLTYAPQKVCPLGKWSAILNEQDYNDYIKNKEKVIETNINKEIMTFDYTGSFKIFKNPTVNKSAVGENSGKVEILFFGNNGLEAPIKIESVSSSCGCTVPDFPKHYIQPNEDFVIKAVFNPAGRVGLNSKSLHIIYNNGYKDTLKFNISVFAENEKK